MKKLILTMLILTAFASRSMAQDVIRQEVTLEVQDKFLTGHVVDVKDNVQGGKPQVVVIKNKNSFLNFAKIKVINMGCTAN